MRPSTDAPTASRPPRARGLKPLHAARGDDQRHVAPPAGAWIETRASPRPATPRASRPPRARGLKHSTCSATNFIATSRPPRARGLKHCEGGVRENISESRPPRARGLKRSAAHLPEWSHRQSRPPRARGLKQVHDKEGIRRMASRPPRARGLKRLLARVCLDALKVAPPAGAWIETDPRDHRPASLRVAPPAGAWIETRSLLMCVSSGSGRAPRGRVD